MLAPWLYAGQKLFYNKLSDQNCNIIFLSNNLYSCIIYGSKNWQFCVICFFSHYRPTAGSRPPKGAWRIPNPNPSPRPTHRQTRPGQVLETALGDEFKTVIGGGELKAVKNSYEKCGMRNLTNIFRLLRFQFISGVSARS